MVVRKKKKSVSAGVLSGVDWEDLLERRPVEMVFESWHDTPQSVFLIRHELGHTATQSDIAGHVR